MLQQKDFFEYYQQHGLQYEAWLNTFQKEENKTSTENYFIQSKTVRDLFQSDIGQLSYKIHVLAIVADWCGDCHRNVPILVHLAAVQPLIELKLLIREEHETLLLPTNGGLKIPYVVFYGQDGHPIARWVERPTIAYQKLAKLYQEVGFTDREKIAEGWRHIFAENQIAFYEAAAHELCEIVNRIQAIQGTSRRINAAPT